MLCMLHHYIEGKQKHCPMAIGTVQTHTMRVPIPGASVVEPGYKKGAKESNTVFSYLGFLGTNCCSLFGLSAHGAAPKA